MSSATAVTLLFSSLSPPRAWENLFTLTNKRGPGAVRARIKCKHNTQRHKFSAYSCAGEWMLRPVFPLNTRHAKLKTLPACPHILHATSVLNNCTWVYDRKLLWLPSSSFAQPGSKYLCWKSLLHGAWMPTEFFCASCVKRKIHLIKWALFGVPYFQLGNLPLANKTCSWTDAKMSDF
jgi:hypothetical protein